MSTAATNIALAEPSRSVLRHALRAMRPKQWSKNLLVFVPLLTSHSIQNLQLVVTSAWAFVAFCLCASAIYVMNDLFDIKSDRAHPTKCRRPFAAGDLSVRFGIGLCILLLVASGLVAGLLAGTQFLLVLIGYALLSTCYSMYLKKRLLIDVVVLSGLYTIRVMAGAVALSVTLSPWLLAFSVFFFLSLALVKRYGELCSLRELNRKKSEGRSYIVNDLEMLESFGPAASFMAVLILCLYVSNDAARSLYRHPEYLWGACPILLYWSMRLWLLAKRRDLAEDPVAFALTDRASIVCGVAVLAIGTAACFG